LVLPPGYDGEVPDGYFVQRSTSYRVICGVRAVPVDGDMQAAMSLIPQVRVRPLDPAQEWAEPRWADLSGKPQDTTPLAWETNLEFWRALHEVVDSEPPLEGHLALYGELAVLGIEKGRPFAPDERMSGILERAAREANAQMRAQAFADWRPERVMWPGTQWEWVTLRENPEFAADSYVDTYAREKWFFQAIGVSPIMMQRSVHTRSLYWLAARDQDGAYFDGSKSYRLTVPLPVPAKLFWSVTVYDAETRSEIRTDRNKAALRSLFELADAAGDASVDLYFGPDGGGYPDDRWVKTVPGQGWFVYFRIYGPEEATFDGSWRLPDFEAL
ncbi:MAG TPA: DUF1214 domain-containing protein, partial [Acidimicrobiales bacterium]|nr:DUF1214 domain-containing protein [Acidimicrobiales bacterium]